MVGDDGLGNIAVMVVWREGQANYEKSDEGSARTKQVPRKIRILKNLQSDWATIRDETYDFR
jgi:hypothetical protein